MPDCILDDDLRWSDDISSIKASDWVWLFEKSLTKGYSWTQNHSRGILWHFSPLCALHALNKNTLQRLTFPLPLRLCQQLAFLDLEYWSNVISGSENSNRIARYLEKVRRGLQEELQRRGGQAKGFTWQPDSTRPWAIRIKHSFGHSRFGRQRYLTRCSLEGWLPYMHDNPIEYGEQVLLSNWAK